MHILLLHIWRQLCLGPLLCHRLVLLALIVSQIPFNLTASSIVVVEVLRQSWCIFRQLKCQMVYFLVVHDSQNIKVWPLLLFKSGILWSPFTFAILTLANNLEKHIRSAQSSWELESIAHTLITIPLSNLTSSCQAFLIWSAASSTISSWRSRLAARNLPPHFSNMLICSSVSTISELDTHCAFNYHA